MSDGEARKLRLGVAGLGRAFMLMLPAFTSDPRIVMRAAADPRPEARLRFQNDFGASAYETVEALCDDNAIDAVYIATPHQLHRAHVAIAAARGKHVLLEKPMALTIDEGRDMIEACRRGGIRLVVGHSHSFDLPYRRTRQMIESGEFGRIRMITAMNFTDFLYRPRRPEELDTDRGGGVVFSQGAHQVDIVRLLGGGRVRTVTAATGAWDPARPTEGAYAALLTFADGCFASLTYSGYAHFDTDEFTGWIGEMGQPKDPQRYGAVRRVLGAVRSPEDEIALKAARAYGASGSDDRQTPLPAHNHFGLIVASCERADLRPGPTGIAIDADHEHRIEPLAPPRIPRGEVLDELYDAVVHDRPPLHSGEWGLATLEACLAILRSVREQRDVALVHQVGLDG